MSETVVAPSTAPAAVTIDPTFKVRSAFAHSLRNSSPIPFNEFLEHFACALLTGRYILKATSDHVDKERFSFSLSLPSYLDEEMREGYVMVEEGTEVPEEMMEKLVDAARNNLPAMMLAEMSKGKLQALFQHVLANFDSISGNASIPSIKRQMTKIVIAALEELGPKTEALESATLQNLDPLLAECEVSMLTAFKEAAEGDELKAYFDQILKLHAELEVDSEEALKDLTTPPAEHEHEHSHDGHCCGGH